MSVPKHNEALSDVWTSNFVIRMYSINPLSLFSHDSSLQLPISIFHINWYWIYSLDFSFKWLYIWTSFSHFRFHCKRESKVIVTADRLWKTIIRLRNMSVRLYFAFVHSVIWVNKFPLQVLGFPVSVKQVNITVTPGFPNFVYIG